MTNVRRRTSAETRKRYITKIELDKPADPMRVEFVREPNSPPLPESFRQLISKIQDVEHVVRTVFAQHKKLRKQFFFDLHVTADTGLRGSDYSIEEGLANLESVKTGIAESFPVVRDYYWYRYGKYLLCSVILFLFGGVIYFVYFLDGKNLWNILKLDAKFDQFATIGIALFWIPFGIAIGIFLEYVYSIKDRISFDELIKINPARWHPLQRFANTIIAGYVFAAAMGLGIFQVGIASLLLNEFLTTKPYLALVVGFVTGFASPYVQDIISQIRPTVRNAAKTSS